MDSKTALRSAGTLLSRVRAPASTPWPDGRHENLRSRCLESAVHMKTNEAQIPSDKKPLILNGAIIYIYATILDAAILYIYATILGTILGSAILYIYATIVDVTTLYIYATILDSTILYIYATILDVAILYIYATIKTSSVRLKNSSRR
ncbi:hypothetical protein PoB_007002700 [Plakobranchus ocellatus]|uniref:Uncharacterized protein n=1 Tax=Plakobranchus ocellatus TaxID=259542 RepID=A0AAV4DHP4_9GAST|nr:hypothetical protein PoB_007002700 [Plakobranchus ocellatus]